MQVKIKIDYILMKSNTYSSINVAFNHNSQPSMKPRILKNILSLYIICPKNCIFANRDLCDIGMKPVQHISLTYSCKMKKCCMLLPPYFKTIN